MQSLSENYQLRKSFFIKDEVPTQSMMKQRMNPPLANVYFKSMTPKLKILAGLEPSLNGGGNDWYVPPEEILKGRSVLKPLKKKIKQSLNFLGIDVIGMKLCECHSKGMTEEKFRKLNEEDLSWRVQTLHICDDEGKAYAAEEAARNTYQIRNAYRQFTAMYNTSLTKFQDLLFEAAVNKIKKFRTDTFEKMNAKYERLLKQQAVMLYDMYTAKLDTEKAYLKSKFIDDIAIISKTIGDKLHNINLEKHVAIEKSRKFLECQNLACRIYVALKERQECFKETESMKQKYAKETKNLTKVQISTDFEINLAEEKEKKIQHFNTMWMRKVSLIVKQLQLFVSYSLRNFPEYAHFFINMEKLMLLQLSKGMENSASNNIFIYEIGEQHDHKSTPKVHPFYLVCDKDSKTNVSQNLCPKHRSSSASQLPAIVINKTCIYAACDNFEQFTDVVKNYILRNYTTEDDITDNHEYNYDVPVKYSHSEQLRELKLESSLLQVLQQEIANLKDLPINCSSCQIPHCFDCSRSGSLSEIRTASLKIDYETSSIAMISSESKVMTRKAEVIHSREPKWDSYLQYIKPKKCVCAKLAKKHLLDHLPYYMRSGSCYDTPELLNYKPCSSQALKFLVTKTKRIKRRPTESVSLSKIKETGTQTEDEFDHLCSCFSHDGAEDLCRDLETVEGVYLSHYEEQHIQMVNPSLSTKSPPKEVESFTARRTISLKRFIDQSFEIEEIYMTRDSTV